MSRMSSAKAGMERSAMTEPPIFKLFPLRLTPFEEYMLLDNQPAYPMSCFVLLKLRGEFDVSIFESALRQTLEYHPLLTCAVTEANGRFYWQQTGAIPPVARAPLEADRRFPSAQGIDLFHEPALKVTVCNENIQLQEIKLTGQTNIMFEVHHSACDAAGIVRFIEDIFCRYARQTGFADAQREAVKPDGLARRGTFRLNRGEILQSLSKQFWGIFRAWTFLLNRVLPLTPKKPVDTQKPSADYPAILFRTFTESETQNIRQRVRALGITLNDWLLCAAFFAMNNWREQHVAGEKKGHLRLAVPTNLRTSEDALMPAANIVSMVFLDRKPKDIQRSESFYQGVHREMDHIKRCHLGWAFIHGLAVYRRLFGNVRKMVHGDRCWSTATVSNLGRLFADVPLPQRDGHIRVDDSLELIGVEACPPVRAWTPLGISAMTYADQMVINLHYDPHVLTRGDAQSILEDMAM